MNDNHDDGHDDVDDRPSKSALKREMTALQDLGERLLHLTPGELATVPLDPRLAEALRETRQIKSNSARRRHLQYIGKLMRQLDAEPIQRAVEELDTGQQQRNHAFQRMERLRDNALAQGLAGIETLVAEFPDADRQHLRQLFLQAERERKANKPPAAARKVFRYLREMSDV